MVDIEVDAFLADAVEAINGKLYALGAGWNIIYSAAFPMQHSRLGLGIIVRVPYTATNQNHTLEISLEDEDGTSQQIGIGPNGRIDKVKGDFNVGRPPALQAGDEQVVPMAIGIENLPLEKPGRCCFVFAVDGAERKRLPFRVMQLTQMGPVFTAQPE